MAMSVLNPDRQIHPYPAQYVGPWTMRNGLSVLIRPICPDDEPLMVKFHETLSDRTVYMRYFTSLSLSRRTAHERLVRICTVDYDREMVLVAEKENPQTGEPQIIAVARLNQVQPETKSEAELAVLVSDGYQKNGLGSEMIGRLIQFAQSKKETRLVAEMLRDNVAMQTIFKRLGFQLRLVGDPASVQAVLDL